MRSDGIMAPAVILPVVRAFPILEIPMIMEQKTSGTFLIWCIQLPRSLYPLLWSYMTS